MNLLMKSALCTITLGYDQVSQVKPLAFGTAMLYMPTGGFKNSHQQVF